MTPALRMILMGGSALPRLDLNFSQGTFLLNGARYSAVTSLPGFTFTRATPSVTYAENLAGTLLIPFAANMPRITDKGLLVEESRTNLLTYSQELDNAAWSKLNVGVTANAVAAPDGTMTADKVTPTAGTNTFRIGNAATMAAGLHTVTFYVANAGYNFVRLAVLTPSLLAPTAGAYVDFNLTTGAIATAASRFGAVTATGLTAQSRLVNGFWRVELTFTSPSSLSFLTTIGVMQTANVESFNADGASGVYVWGGQAEAASTASSYITTTTAAVTRAADILSLTGFPATMPTPFAWSVDFLGSDKSSSPLLSALGAGGPGISDNDGGGNVRSGLSTVAYVDTGGTTTATGTAYRTTTLWQAGNYRSSTNGGAVQVSTNATAPVVSGSLGIGYNGTNYPNTYIQRVRVFGALSDGQLQNPPQ